MIKASKLADYAVVIMCVVADLCENASQDQGAADTAFSASRLAEESGLPLPTTQKVVKLLARASLLTGSRGKQGGYRLTYPPHEISVQAMIEAVDGPIALTACSPNATDSCDALDTCKTKSGWSLISNAVTQTLERLTLEDIRVSTPSNLIRLPRLSDAHGKEDRIPS